MTRVSDITVQLIVALDDNNGIGKDGKIPWYFREDMKHFQETTMGHPIIMGSKTHDSIGRNLKGRTNIVLSRNPLYEPFRASYRFDSPEDALIFASGFHPKPFVIGGSQIYQHYMDSGNVDTIWITQVSGNYGCDTFFPSFDIKDWKMEIFTKSTEKLRFIKLSR